MDELSLEECKDLAKKYKTVCEFKKHGKWLYDFCNENNWLESVCEGKPKTQGKGYWTIERSLEEATKYSSRTSFSKCSYQAYFVLSKNNLLDEACLHMPINDIRNNIRYRYAIEFPSVNKVYVGITYDLENRKREHFKKSDKNISNHHNKHVRELLNNNIDYLWKPSNTPFHIKKAKEMETEIYNNYKNNNWDLLNISSLGGTGTKISKNLHECHLDALKYKTRKEFYRKSGGSYEKARRKGWLDKICSHMINKHIDRKSWTYDKCKEIALTCKTRNEFYKKANGAYKNSLENNWLDDFIPSLNRKCNKYWHNYDNCKEVALKCETRTEFSKKYNSAYRVCKNKGWDTELCSHMTVKYTPKEYWLNYDNCKTESLKYKNRNDFYNNSRNAYKSSKHNNWLDEFHPKKKKKKK